MLKIVEFSHSKIDDVTPLQERCIMVKIRVCNVFARVLRMAIYRMLFYLVYCEGFARLPTEL